MPLSKIAVGLSATLLIGNVAGYSLQKDYTTSFFSDVTFFTQTDPTHGDVDYVTQSEAQSLGLVSDGSSGIYMGVQNSSSVSGGQRKSVRVASSATYDTGLFVIDVEHMPYGCGTWPAFWLVGPSWPNNGEIDIIEGVNNQQSNKMTLHSGPGCQISQGGDMTGSVSSTDCDVTGGSNEGCGIMAGSNSYGQGLNQAGGGIYATEVSSDGINIWFWAGGSAPQDATGSSPDPTGWGEPTAKFSGCDISSHFKDMSIVFDTTFCGDWAGQAWGSDPSCSSKASSCDAYVSNPPEGAFDDAYWQVKSLKVYSGSGSSSSSSGSTGDSGSVSSGSGSTPSETAGSGSAGRGGNAPSHRGSRPTGAAQAQQPASPPAPTAAPEPTPPTPGEPLDETWFEPHPGPTGGWTPHGKGHGHWHQRRRMARRANAWEVAEY